MIKISVKNLKQLARVAKILANFVSSEDNTTVVTIEATMKVKKSLVRLLLATLKRQKIRAKEVVENGKD